MRREILLLALLCVSVKAQVKVERDVAPPSARFPASWYPPDSEVTSTLMPVVGRPYVGVMVTTTHSPMPNGEVGTFSQKATQMRDSAGRLYSETLIKWPGPDGKILDIREITVDDPVAHCHLTWSEPRTRAGQPTARVRCESRILHRQPASPPVKEGDMVRDEKEPGGGLSHIEPLGAKLLDGVRVLGKRVTRTATATVAEGWYSPELQEILVLKVGDPEVYRAELTEIVQKEPDATSFYPPKGYKILSDIEQQEQR